MSNGEKIGEEIKIKVVAHRGWSVGEEENTLNAFKKSYQKKGVFGVEFDVRWSTKRDRVVIAHDLDILDRALNLDVGLGFLSQTNLELFIEMKEFDESLFLKIIESLDNYNLKSKTIIFGFKEVATKFPWNNKKGVRLGIISKYPWEIKKDIFTFNPDFVLMGWDDRRWTKIVFKLIWNIFSLTNLCKKYIDTNFVIGVAKTSGDYKWLLKQKGIYGITADHPFEWLK